MVKLLFKPALIELNAHPLKETVFEIVQIPHYDPLIEITHGITEREIKMTRNAELYSRQTRNHLTEKFNLGGIETATFTSLGKRCIQSSITTVLLQVA